jgi:membrane-bound lytic murein transglycosylase D
VDRAVQRTGYADFWKLRDIGALPKETTNYVPVIVAITIMAKNPKDYGLDQIELEPALESETVKLTATTNLALVADATEKPVAEIKDLNPALLHGVAPEGYELRLPKGTAVGLMAALENIPASRRNTWRMHRVEPGDTLAAIAKRYNAAPAAIAAANNNISDAPSAGDLLVIPSTYDEMSVRSTPKRFAAKSRNTSNRPALSRTSKTVKPVAKQAGVRVTARTASAVRKVADTRRVPAKVLHRKANVKTAQAFTIAAISR